MSRTPRVSGAVVSWQEIRMLWQFATLTTIRRRSARTHAPVPEYGRAR